MEKHQTSQKAKRSQRDYLGMTHSILVNHLQTEVKKSRHKPQLNKLNDFLTKRVWAWFYYYMVNRFGQNHPYNGYPESISGIYPLGGKDAMPVKIAVAADWATDTEESVRVGQQIKLHEPDYTIHLGDTYYVGAPHEIAVNFTDKNSPWVRGKKGSFAVLGNHEMYARGIAFFKKLLPTLGLFENGRYTGQHAGYFCLENDYWRILGLDTGYHSIGKYPFLEMLPWFSPDCHLDDQLIEWLVQRVRLNDESDKRGLVFLTHHQYISAFKTEGEYLVPAMQLAKLIGKKRPVIWLFGHEHKFSIFEQAQVGEGVTAYGRCIGHGGMPVEVNSREFEPAIKTHGHSKLVMVDNRVKSAANETPLGYNGYAILTLDDRKLDISYHDINEKLLTETWIADTATGAIKGAIKVYQPALQTVGQKTWEDAVKI